MKNSLLSLLFVFIAATGCNKEKPLCAGCGNPVIYQGEITARTKDSVSIESAFALFDTLNLPIDMIGYFSYHSALPADSMASIKKYLKSRPYIDSNFKVGINAIVSPTVININIGFGAMNIASQQDWIALKTQMMLTDNNDSMKVFRIQVPKGQEQSWADSLNKYSIIKYAGPIMLAP